MIMSLRVRSFVWLTLLVAIFILAQNGFLLMADLHDLQTKAPEEEHREIKLAIVSLALDLATAAFTLVIAWGITTRMIAPIRSVAKAARNVRAGQLDHRFEEVEGSDEIASLGRIIKEGFDKYYDAVRSLQRFAGNASHELRTPLTALRSVGEVALSKERNAEEYRDSIASMLEQCADLSHIVEQLLEMATLNQEAIRSQFSPVAMDVLISETVSLYKGYATQQEVELSSKCDVDLLVNGNSSLLQQVVINLLDNAIRATPCGGEIQIQAYRSENRQVIISITDTGPGIPVEYRKRIFEPFGHVVGNKRGRAGLGLTIVADIIRVHDGEIHVHNADTGGASFEVILKSYPYDGI